MQFPHNSIMLEQSTDEHYQQRYQEFLQRLKTARIETGLTQQEAAEKLGKSQSFVSRSENGERRIDVIELQGFANIYQRPIAYFIGE